MKKLLAILVMLSYTCCALGFTISIHHCKGEFRYASLKEEKGEKKCCDSKRKMPKNCCKHQKIAFEKSDDLAQTAYSFKNVQAEATLPLPNVSYLAPSSLPKHINDYLVVYLRPPPLLSGQPPLYIIHSVFRI